MTDDSNCNREGSHIVSLKRSVSVREAVSGFKMRCEPRKVEAGDTIEFILENVSNGKLQTSAEPEFTFQRNVTPAQADSTWEDILYMSNDRGHRLVLGNHPPGEIYRWKFTLTADGQLEPTDDDLPGYVCPPVTSGRYRFVYHGVQESLSAYPGVEFEVE